MGGVERDTVCPQKKADRAARASGGAVAMLELQAGLATAAADPAALLAAYKTYIAHELASKTATPDRIRLIYERAVRDNALQPECVRGIVLIVLIVWLVGIVVIVLVVVVVAAGRGGVAVC